MATLEARSSSGLVPRADPGTSNSASTLVSTLVPVLLQAVIWLALFLIFRRKFVRYYQPRTFLTSLPVEQRSKATNQSLTGWFSEFWNTPDTYVLNHHTLDGYLFLRFLKMAVMTCLVGCVITWPVLFPINATGGGGKSQLDILTFANVTNNYYKMFAHAGCAIIFFSFVIFMITRESIYYINLRQAYLMSPLYASRMSSRTVLFTSVPEEYMNEGKLRAMLEPGVRRVWLATDCKDLSDKVDQRDSAALKLEGAETALIKKANQNRLDAEKKAAKKGGDRQASEEATLGEGGSIAARYLNAKERPTHRLKMLIGKKVDTIDWCRAELQKLIPEVDALQAKHRAADVKKLNSVFVEFETLSQAQAAYQSLAHHQVLHMAPRYTGMTPGEVIWSNLRILWWERVIRNIATISFVVALIIFWAIPVAVVGFISNLNYVDQKVPFLHFIQHVPKVILGVITGLLPCVMLAVLMALLPIILRLMAKLGGDPTLSAVELTVQNSYFGFQVVQVFLVTTISSAATSVVTKIINDPSSATTLLASNLPKASNFYLAYFVLQGLSVVSGVLLSLVGLLLFKVLGKFLDNTPRKMYKRWISLSGIGWGTVFPVYTNLFVIAICYAAIAPLVLGFAAIGLFFFYVAYRYNLLYVSNANIDTKGLVYPRALQQLFVGLYIAQVCLIGLFAIATGSSRGALGPLILMILMLIFTVLYQVSLNSAIGPLLRYLPKSLDAEERRLLTEENGVNGHDIPEGDRYADGASKEGALPSTNGHNGTHNAKEADLGPAPHKKPNLFVKWLRPDVYTDYATMRRLVPKTIAIQYSPEDEANAFYDPSINKQVPLLWIPRDTMGISRQEIQDTGKIIPITDEGSHLDEQGKIAWGQSQDDQPPIYRKEPYY